MVNPYQKLNEYEGEDWDPVFEQLGLTDVFFPLSITFTAPESMRKIIRYIVWTYSLASDRLITGMDWEANKHNNFNQAGLPENMWEQIGLLRDPLVLGAVHGWLEYQDDPVFKQLQCLRDLKLEMQLSAVGKIVKSSSEIDYDQKFKNANYASDLDKMIRQLENQLVQNQPQLKEAVREARFARKVTIGAETYAR